MANQFDPNEYADRLFKARKLSLRAKLLRLRNNVILLAIAVFFLGLLILAIYGHIVAFRACGWGGWFMYGKNLFWAYYWGYCP